MTGPAPVVQTPDRKRSGVFRFRALFGGSADDGEAPAAVGRRAESRVARHLFWHGWRLCARNWIGGGGELDLVASRWRTLLVVEVRRRDEAGEAWRSVDRAKLDRTLAAAQALISQHGLQCYRLRIDIAAVDARGRISRLRDVLRDGLVGS